MQRTLFITGTDTGAGKTVLTALLAGFLWQRDGNVAAFKPVCSGGRDDARKIHAALGGTLSLDDINPWHFRAAVAPSLAAQQENRSVSLAQVVRHIRAKQKNVELTLVEGAGGLLSPVGKDFDSRDLIIALRAAPLIVAQNRLGVVNHLLLTLEALPKNARAQARIVLMSPAKSDAATPSNTRLLGEFFPAGRILGLPWLGRRWDVVKALGRRDIRRTMAKLVA